MINNNDNNKKMGTENLVYIPRAGRPQISFALEPPKTQAPLPLTYTKMSFCNSPLNNTTYVELKNGTVL